MKKIATKFVLVAASAFIFGTTMAQTDTTKTPVPVPDTTETPVPDTTETPAPDTTTVPDPTEISIIHADKNTSLAMQLSKYNSGFYAITNRELLSAKQHDIKTEEENEA
ncbi:MAG TPA: hypothetical protein PKE30_19755 [Niabella sp.]|nr:hypothetical protein [Niabella sp.]